MVYGFSLIMKEKFLKWSEIKTVRERLIIEQNNICPICKKPMEKPVLDHYHRKKLGGSGKIRGVLCFSCNAYIGPMENRAKRHYIDQGDIPTVLRNTADYLECEQSEYLHPSEKAKRPILSKRDFNRMVKKFKTISSNKPPVYPLSEHITKEVQKYYDMTGLEPKFNK